MKNGSLKILDVGCSIGIFLKMCDLSGMQTYGLEKYKELAEKAKKSTKGIVINQDAEIKWNIHSNYMDCVTLFDIAEHTKKPYNILEEAARVLKPGGIIFITTPNGNFAYKMRSLPIVGIKDRTPGHINVHPMRYWRKELMQHNFKEIYVSYGNNLSHIRGIGVLSIILKKLSLNPNQIPPFNLFSTSVWLIGRKL